MHRPPSSIARGGHDVHCSGPSPTIKIRNEKPVKGTKSLERMKKKN